MSTARTAYRLLVESRPLVVVDVETCPGADREGDHIVAIAAVTCRQGRQRHTWATLVNPGVPITNSQQHGLTDDDVAGAPQFADIVDDLDEHLAEPGTILVCHNAGFDVGRLHLEYSRLDTGDTLRDVAVLDTMKLPGVLGHALPGRSRKLARLCDHFGVINTQPHNAASDAAATADVLHALLRVAAENGYADLGDLHAAAGGTTTRLIDTAGADTTPVRSATVELPAEHLATHTTLLPLHPTPDELDQWVNDALDCARLRCHLLAPKARTAVAHAPDLHRRLTAALKANSFDPGQGATLVGALNILAGPGLDTAKNTSPLLAWWRRHRDLIVSLPRCDTPTGECPDCRDGDPCPIDVAHQPIATAILVDRDGRIPLPARKLFAQEGQMRKLQRWLDAGLPELAGFGAALVIDAWLADHNDARADRVLDMAVTGGAADPRLTRLHAQRLALHGRDLDAISLVEAALTAPTTDPGYDELAVWFDRWRAQRRKRPTSPNPKPGSSPRNARPAGRVRPRRFAV